MGTQKDQKSKKKKYKEYSRSASSGSGSDSDESIISTGSITEKLSTDIKKGVAQPKQAHSSRKRLTYNSLKDFFANFSESKEYKNENLTSSRTTITTSDNKQTDFEAPLLGLPTTVREILGLDPDEIKKAFENAEQNAIKTKSNRGVVFLLAITIGAMIVAPLCTFMRENIQDDTTFWFSKGHITNPAPGVTESSYISSWTLAVFNLVINMLAVNPTEAAYEMLGVLNPEEFLKKLQEARKNPGRWIYHTLAKLGLFIPVSAVWASPDIAGLSDMTHNDHIGFKISAGVSIEVLGIVYYLMFAERQFEKHLDALADYAFKLANSIYKKSSNSSANDPQSLPDKKATTESEDESEEDDLENHIPEDPVTMATSNDEKNKGCLQLLEDISVAFEKRRIVMANWGLKGIFTLYIFMKITTETLGVQRSPALERLYIFVGLVGLTQTALTRTLQTYNSFKFEALTPKEIKEAKVGKIQNLMNAGKALLDGGPLAVLIYSYVSNKVYSLPLAVGVGTIFSVMTWAGLQYRSRGEVAALEKKEKQISQPGLTINQNQLDLHQLCLMPVSDLFRLVIMKSKSSESHKHLVRGATVLNHIARVAGVMIFGDVANNLGELLSDHGVSFGGEVDDTWKWIRQLCLTLFIAMPAYMADIEVFSLGLLGKPDDTNGSLPYLNAKRLISGWFGMVPYLLTPKQRYEFSTLLKALCVLDQNLNDTFRAVCENFKDEHGERISDDRIIKILRAGVQEEYLDTINRLKRWVSNQNLMENAKERKWYKSYEEMIKILSFKKSAAEFTAEDYPKIKKIEYHLFCVKMHHWQYDENTPKYNLSESSNEKEEPPAIPDTALSDSTMHSANGNENDSDNEDLPGSSTDMFNSNSNELLGGRTEKSTALTFRITLQDVIKKSDRLPVGRYIISKEALAALDEADKAENSYHVKLTPALKARDLPLSSSGVGLFGGDERKVEKPIAATPIEEPPGDPENTCCIIL